MSKLFHNQTFYTKPKALTQSVDLHNPLMTSTKIKTLKPITKGKSSARELPRVDLEFLQDENIKLKVVNHKHVQLTNLMKVDMIKLEDDNKRVLSLVYDILSRAGIDYQDIQRYMQTLRANDVTDKYSFQVQMSSDNESKLKDSLVNLQLKNYIFQLKKTLGETKEELEYIKFNSKVGNYIKLERELSKKTEELKKLMECYLKLKTESEAGENRIIELQKENNSFKGTLDKYNSLLEMLKDKEKEKQLIRSKIPSIQPYFTNSPTEPNTGSKTECNSTSSPNLIDPQKVENQKLQNKINQLQKEITQLKKDNLELKKANESYIEKSNSKTNELLSQIEKKKISYNQVVSEFNTKISILNMENKGYISKLEKYSTELRNTSKQLEDLNIETVEIQQENAKFKDEINAMSKRINQLSNENSLLLEKSEKIVSEGKTLFLISYILFS